MARSVLECLFAHLASSKSTDSHKVLQLLSTTIYKGFDAVKRSRRSCVFVALIIFPSFVGLIQAQVDTGTPSFSAYESHQVDTINLQNLAVSLSVPVMSKSGAFPFSFSFSGAPSSVYTIVTSVYPGIGQQPFAGLVNGILGYYGQISAYATVSAVTCPSSYGSGSAFEYSNWYILLADGTRHYLPTTDVIYVGTSCSNSFTDVTIDGSGYTLSVSADPSEGYYVVNSIYTKGGISLTGSFVTNPNGAIKDSNGNSVSYNGTAWTDTLGLTALTENTSGGNTWSWTDASGNSPTTSLTNSSYTSIRTAYGCSGITDTDQTLTPPASASFPDGTTLGLAWEQTPGYPSDTTGRVSQITLRSGGTVTYNWNPNTLGRL
jgi:hypothetical protein